MRVALGVPHYLSEDVFSLELGSVFGAVWLYAGLLENFKDENQFVTVSRAGYEIVVQKMAGEIRAFLNSCAHRRSRIQTEAAGKRALICPYHGWAYDSEGCLLQSPRLLSGEPCEAGQIRLQSVRVECAGPLVFINLNLNAICLKEYLGELYDKLEAIKVGVGAIRSSSHFPIKANWKVAVENTLEFHHVGLIHRQTFAKLQACEHEQSFAGSHSMTQASIAVSDTRRTAIAAKLSAREYVCDGYEHFFIFPNLTVATTQGLSFSVQYFQPVDVGNTELTTTTLACSANGKMPFNPALADAIATQAGAFNESVFQEDRDICEHVQVGLHSAEHAGLLTEQEVRIQQFHLHYLQQLGN